MSQTPIDFHAEQYTRAAQWLLSGTHRGSLTAIKIKLGRRFMVVTRNSEMKIAFRRPDGGITKLVDIPVPAIGQVD